jgi:hypothetical protein
VSVLGMCRPQGQLRYVTWGSKSPQVFEHLEDRNLALYEEILQRSALSIRTWKTHPSGWGCVVRQMEKRLPNCAIRWKNVRILSGSIHAIWHNPYVQPTGLGPGC